LVVHSTGVDLIAWFPDRRRHALLFEIISGGRRSYRLNRRQFRVLFARRARGVCRYSAGVSMSLVVRLAGE
jgi:hypothetical protein